MTSRQKILVADADRGAALALATAIRQQGWEPLAASDATSTLSAAIKMHPDGIVLAARMSGALDTCKRLRHSVHTAVTPIVAIGVRSASETQQWLMAGAQEVLEGAAPATGVCAALQRHVGAGPAVTQAPDEVLRSAARLAALKASGLLDTAPERAYDNVTHLVAKLLGAPTALLSLVDKDRQFFKAHVGLGEPWAGQRQTPLSHSFCQWVVSGREQISITDARSHPLLKSNLAIRDLGVVAYAGVPVCNAAGETLGSLCAIDQKPRQWNEKELRTLQELTRMVEGCAAHAELASKSAGTATDFDRYVGAAGDAVKASVSILRRCGTELGQTERDELLDLIDLYARDLVQLNRMIQVSRALH